MICIPSKLLTLFKENLTEASVADLEKRCEYISTLDIPLEKKVVMMRGHFESLVTQESGVNYKGSFLARVNADLFREYAMSEED